MVTELTEGEAMNDHERTSRYAEVAIEALELNVRRAHDRMVADEMAAKFMAVADAEQAELSGEVERWKEKAQEAGGAYGKANSKHHAELDRANRLERLADTLAGKAVDLEDRAEAAERALADEQAKVSRVEALLAREDGRAEKVSERYAELGIIDPKSGSPLRLVGIVSTCDVRAALDDPETSNG